MIDPISRSIAMSKLKINRHEIKARCIDYKVRESHSLQAHSLLPQYENS